MAVSVLQSLPERKAEPHRAGEIGPFHRMRVRRVPAGHPGDRRFEVIEAALLDEGGELGAETRGPGRLMEDDAAAGLLNRLLDRLDVDRDDRAEVDHLRVDPF